MKQSSNKYHFTVEKSSIRYYYSINKVVDATKGYETSKDRLSNCMKCSSKYINGKNPTNFNAIHLRLENPPSVNLRPRPQSSEIPYFSFDNYDESSCSGGEEEEFNKRDINESG